MGTVQAKELHSDNGFEDGLKKEIHLSEVPVKVERIHIDGLERTKDDIVAKHVRGVLKATNFEEMVKKSQEAKVMLEGMGLFKEVMIGIDTSKGPDARPDGYEITLNVTEHRRVTGGVSTMVGTNEGSMLFNIKLPNTFGRAERLNGEYTYGTKNNVGFGLNFTKPLQGDPNLNFTLAANRYHGDYPWSGYKETDNGVMAGLAFPTLLGQHQLSWEGVWRELAALSATTAFAVREHAGHSLKSSLKHTWSRDTRDSRVLPSKGYMLKQTAELAGLGGDVNFLKKEVELQLNKPLFLDCVLQASLAGGVMKPIQPGRDLRLPDRFYLGGPLTLRGFNLKGAGPHSDGCAMGADAYWLAAAHLYTPLPFRPGRGGFGDLFRTHFFVNAGNLTNLDFKDHWKANVYRLGEALRLSYGAGVVFKMGGIARLELNYCVPVRLQKGDSAVHGLQFGIGVGFL